MWEIKCKICQSDSREFAQATILNKYTIRYFQCSHCQFIQTEDPYWLSEAYAHPMSTQDDGLVFRNLMLSQITQKIIEEFFTPSGHFLDYGGGYGLLVRLMRDIRFQFDWFDPFCPNLFAPEFPVKRSSYEVVTAFELFEHFVNPLAEIEKIFEFSRQILFSTELLPPHHPHPDQWWYYALSQGQHISFYTPQAFCIIAEKFKVNYYSNGSSIHLFTEKQISAEHFSQLTQYNPEKSRQLLAQSRDYRQLFHPSLSGRKNASLSGDQPSINSSIIHPIISHQLGVNIAGYVSGEFGLGEGVRANIRSLEAAQIPFVINNFTLCPHRQLDKTYENFCPENPYAINLIQVNADEIKTFREKNGEHYFKNRYNIGFWAWELPEFPPEWMSVFNDFNEIWTYSNYCVDALAPIAPIPVIKILPSISLPIPTLTKEDLGWPPNAFIFLFIFDFFSQIERKNPQGVIQAFKQAFPPAQSSVYLIIKSANSEKFPQQKQALNALIAEDPRIHHIESYLSKAEINSLLYHCDCYVSLHRSEGFGLTMAEAMFYGKPVIATGYSSNLEFMNLNNSFLVSYQLTEIPLNYGPYKKGSIWANPNINHASFLMKSLFENRQHSETVGKLGAQTIQTLLSPETRGKLIKKRLENILEKIQNSSANLPLFHSSPNMNHPTEFPLVSICIPTYNGEAFLHQALESAFNQTYPNLEIIIADDGSQDKTIEIAQSFQNSSTSIDYRIILHRNYGLSQNWNFSLSQAQGKYIKFLFQDDFLEPHCVEKMVNLAEQDEQIGMVFSPRGILIASGEESNPLFQNAFRSIRQLYKSWSNLQEVQWGKDLLLDPHCLNNPINKIGEPTTVLIRKDVFDKIGLFDSQLLQLVDVDMWFRIMGHYKIGFVNEELSCLRLHSGQQTWKNFAKGENRQDIQRLYTKILNNPVYNFLPSSLKEVIEMRLILQSDLSRSDVERWVKNYQDSPADQNAIKRLRELRQKLSEKLLGFSLNTLEKNYSSSSTKKSDLSQIYDLLLNSGIKDQRRTPAEENFLEKVKVSLSQFNHQTHSPIHHYLVIQLYLYAYEIPLEYEQKAIPEWFIKRFLQFLMESPVYFQKVGQIQAYCHYCQTFLDYIYASFPQNSQLALYLADFMVKHHKITPFLNGDTNLHKLLTISHNIQEYYLQKHSLLPPNSPPKISTKTPPIKMGIILDHLGFNRATICTIPIIENLDRSLFQLIVYNSRIEDCKLGVYCQNQVNQWVTLPESLSDKANRIIQDQLDLLLIASDDREKPSPDQESLSLSVLYAQKLAPQQIVLGAAVVIPLGGETIDYYLTGSLLTTPENQREYGNKLLTIPGSGMCFSNAIPPQEAKVHPLRQSWGASEDTTIFISLVPFARLTPELRETWTQILLQIPQSILVLFPFRPRNSYPMASFFQEMRLSLQERGLDSRRLVMIKNLPGRADVLQCLKLGDIYLDGFPYTGSMTLIDALTTTLPPVVREGQTLRAKRSASLLRELGLEELITHSESAYIQQAIELGTRPELRQYYRQLIQQKMIAPPFFDGLSYGKFFQEELLKIWKKSLNQF